MAESQAVQEQLASLRAALRNQDKRQGLQFKDAAAAAVSESRLPQCWSGELRALQAASRLAVAAVTLALHESQPKLSATSYAQVCTWRA